VIIRILVIFVMILKISIKHQLKENANVQKSSSKIQINVHHVILLTIVLLVVIKTLV
jgi:hypothetical protein